MRHVHLDPVRAVVELFACGLARFHRAVDNLCAFWHLQFRRVPFQRISPSGRDRPRHHQQPRPRNVASLNRLLDADIPVTRPLGFHVAECGEALLQRPPGRDRGSRRPHRQRRGQNVSVVAALRGIFSLQKDVRVRIDQARKHGLFRQVDHRRADRNLRIRRVRDALDAVAPNDDHLIASRLVVFAIDERAGTNDSNLRR
jgi:hypothetical protein